jgi:TRAP-type C4-dicarboxylate transport system permease large subunit
MHRERLAIVCRLRHVAAMALVPACLAIAGCAGSALADFDSERPITKKAAVDDSFPSADQVGLSAAAAAGKKPSDDKTP